MKPNRTFILFFLFALPLFPSSIFFDFEKTVGLWQSGVDNQEITLSDRYSFTGKFSLKIDLKDTKVAWIKYPHILNLHNYDRLSFTVYLPDGNLSESLFKFYIKDEEWNWFETDLLHITCGEEKEVTLDISAESFQWHPVGHFRGWNSYVKQGIKEIGVIFFLPHTDTGFVYIDSIRLTGQKDIDRQPCLYNFHVNSNRVKKFEKFEVRFDISPVPTDPFDTDELTIKGYFTSPSGRTVIIPAFFFQDYLRYLDSDGEKLIPYGTNCWKLRFTPEEAGTYKYNITVNYNGNVSEFPADTFFVENNSTGGFLGWDKHDPFYMSFRSGEFFYPIGHTLRSPDDTRSPYPYEFVPPRNMGTFAYDNYFKRMSENGENYARVWMSAWWAGLEWTPSYAPHYKGLGRYSMENAWRLDYIIDAAERYGIYLDLTIINHGQFSVNPDAEWWDNPYNIINGGMLETPDEFFINDTAADYFKKRLDYIVSRWGYSTAVAFWELWNEIDLTGYYDTLKVKKWHEKVVPYLSKIDPYGHLITTHYCRRETDPLIWALPQIEMIVGNSYSTEMVSSIEQFFIKRKPFEKPLMVNEYGVGKDRKLLENNLHAGIWASSMTPMTGTALFWWWPFIDYYDIYFHYRALSEFWRVEDRRGKDFQIAGAVCESSSGELSITGIQNTEEGFFWVYNKKLFNTRKPVTSVLNKNTSLLKFNDFIPGTYSVEFWDTYNGKVIGKTRVLFKENKQEIETPEFLNDIAVKIKRVQ
jgi:hypothetical protein